MINIKNKIFIVPIVFNILVVLFLYIDFLLPTNKIDKEIFSSFYSVVNYYPSKGGGGKEVLTVLECKSGKTYRIPASPIYSEEEFNGKKIEIEKTFLFGKQKVLRFVEINKLINISLLSENLIIIIYTISIIISLFNLFFEIKFLEIPLAFSFVFVFFTTIIYLFYF
jgi:hypothetical protein